MRLSSLPIASLIAQNPLGSLLIKNSLSRRRKALGPYPDAPAGRDTTVGMAAGGSADFGYDYSAAFGEL